jgi:hypothetical protein
MTYSKNTTEKMNFEDLELKKVNLQLGNNTTTTTSMPQLGEISQSHLSVSKSPNFSGLGSVARPQAANIPNKTTPAQPPRQQNITDSNTSSIMGAVTIMLAIVIAGFGAINEFRPHLVAKPCVQLKSIGLPLDCYQEASASGQALLASKNPVLKVTSDPIGAHIYVNSQPTNQMTPAEVEVDDRKPFTISLSMSGYKNENRRFNGLPPGNFASFKLVSIPSGAIIVRVVGGEAFMGAQKLRNGEKLVVDANKEIVLRAVNPISGTSKETRVIVNINETKEVILSPR